MGRTIFVDTSAIIGLFARRDQHHDRAVRGFEELAHVARILVTSEPVLYETVTGLRRIGGLDAALTAWGELEGGRLCHVQEVPASQRAAARILMKKYSQLLLSMTDCTSFVLMKILGISEVFTFDDDFAKVGFGMFPPDR